MSDRSNCILDPKRLEGLRNAQLLDTPAEEYFDRVTRLASRLLEAPVALVSLVDADRQFFKSQIGLPEPWAAGRQTPLSHSFCQHVVITNDLLVVNDAREDVRVCDNMAITDLNVIAYIGAPLNTSDGNTIGALCVIDSKPRNWTSEQAMLLSDLASFVTVEIERRRTTVAEKIAKTQATEADHRSDEIFRLLVEGVKDYAILMLHPDGTIQTWSDGAAHLTGYSSSEMIGSNFAVFFPESDIAAGEPQRTLQAASDLGRVCADGWRVRKDGTRFFASVTIAALKDAAGVLRGYASVTKDLTESREAEKAIREAAVRARSDQERADGDMKRRFLADAMPQIVWTATPDGNVAYYNDRWFTYTGMTFDQTKDLGWKSVIHPEDLQHCVDVWTTSLATEVPYEIEYRLKRGSDGAYRWHLGRALARRDARGVIVEWVGTCTDIHDQKLIARALELSRNELETRVAERTAQLQQEKRFVDAILDNVSDGIVACDASGALTLVNRATREWHGFPADAAPASDWAGGFNLYLADGVTPMQQTEVPLYRALQGERVSNVELVIAPVNATRRRVVASGRALIDCDGRKFGAVVGIHDITERAAADERFRTLFEFSSDPHFLCDETGIIDCNQATVALLNCQNKSQLVLKNPARFSPEYQSDGRPSLQKFLEMNRIAAAQGRHRFVWTIQKVTGELVPVEVSLTRIQLGGKDAMLAAWHDLTERVQAEATLREANALLRASEQRFQAFMDNSPVIAWIKNEKGQISYVNRRYADEFSPVENLLGKTDFDLFPPAVAKLFNEEDARVLAGETFIGDHSVVSIDGSTRDWQVTKFLVNDTLGIPSVAGFAMDVTPHRRATQELQQAYESLAEAHKKLARSETRFQAFMDNSPFVAWIKDETRTISYANRRYAAEMPAFENNLVGRTDAELFPPDVAKRVREEDLKVLQGETYTGHHQVVRFDGTTRAWQVTKFPLNDAEGNPSVAGFAMDVTEQRRATDDLQLAYWSLAEAHAAQRQSEERFQAFMDNSPAVCSIKDDHSRLVYMNRRFESLFNTSSAKLLGKNDSDFLPEDIAQQTMANDRKILESGVPAELVEHVPLPNGEMRQWMSLKFPLRSANGEKLIGGMAFDVTARMSSESELARQKEFIETVLENVSDGIIACDNENRITYLNPEILNMLGLDRVPSDRPAEWATEHLALFDPVSHRQLEWNERPLGRAMAGETVNGVEFLIKPKPGAQFNILISARALTDSTGAVCGAVAAWHDITDLRRSQEELLAARDVAAAANEAKSEFLANMSHEIRTPMTAMLGFADLLCLPDQSEETRMSHVQTIRRNGEHLLSIINDILDLSKIEAGKLTIERIHCSPMQIVAEVESLMRVRAIEKNIAFAVQCDRDIPKAICSDPTRLRQILLNLVSNAVKFTHTGGVCLKVSLVGDGHDNRIQFDVIDTGIGLTKEQLDNLFHPFAQADNSTTRRFGGTGLGLAICKRMAAALGGDISVTSVPGRGSSFKLVLDGTEVPMLESTVSTDPAGDNNDALSIGDGRDTLAAPIVGRILLAEDGVDNQRLVTFYLEQAGMNVDWAADGRIAVQMVQDAAGADRQYDLILMDMQMPKLDGYDATRKLRQLGFDQIPIVAFTAHAFAEEREKCQKCGCNDYVTKPIEPKLLLQTIQKQLARGLATVPPATSVAAQLNVGSAQNYDAAPIHSCRENDRVIRGTLHDYVDHLPQRVDRLVSAIQNNELATLRDLMGQIKASGGLYGFPQISQSAASIESAIDRSDPLKDCAAEVGSLIETIRRVWGYDRSKEETEHAAPEHPIH